MFGSCWNIDSVSFICLHLVDGGESSTGGRASGGWNLGYHYDVSFGDMASLFPLDDYGNSINRISGGDILFRSDQYPGERLEGGFLDWSWADRPGADRDDVRARVVCLDQCAGALTSHFKEWIILPNTRLGSWRSSMRYDAHSTVVDLFMDAYMGTKHSSQRRWAA